MNHLSQLEKLTLLDALALAICRTESTELKKEYMNLARKVKAFS